MGLSRRKFTKEMKLAAIRQLETGSSAAEVARAFEINPNLLHRWRKEFRHGPGNAFHVVGKRRWDETKVAQLERKVEKRSAAVGDSLPTRAFIPQPVRGLEYFTPGGGPLACHNDAE